VNLISTRHTSLGDFFVVKFFNFVKSIFEIYILSQIHCFLGKKSPIFFKSKKLPLLHEYFRVLKIFYFHLLNLIKFG
jgi:hypothetical protein